MIQWRRWKRTHQHGHLLKLRRTIFLYEKDDLNNVDSDKFRTIIREVDNLHQLVQKPREQVADAEALLGISSTLMTSVKSHSNGGLTPKDFFSGLIEKLSNHNGHQAENAQLSIDWEVIGSAVSKVFGTNINLQLKDDAI